MPWNCRQFPLPVESRPLVMGIVNVTPDSFSDGGRFAGEAQAVAHGVKLAAEGADILDVGGESTRPGAAPVPVEEESRRVVPVVRALARETGLPISVDTMKAPVAAAALEAGAAIVNDVAAFRLDIDLFRVARESGCGVVFMHMRGEPRTMQADPHYEDVVGEVRAFLLERARAALEAGIAPDRLALDPGIGFGKTADHNWALLRRLPDLSIPWSEALAPPEGDVPISGSRPPPDAGVHSRPGGPPANSELRTPTSDGAFPLLVGLSRKSLLGALTGRGVEDRLGASLGGALAAWRLGARILRVHDVKETCDALRVAGKLLRDVVR